MLSLPLNIFLSSVITGVMCLSSTVVNAGISLGATRLVYMQDSMQAMMPVVNSSQDKRFLINSWMDDKLENKIDTIMMSPRMFVSEPKTKNSIRIVNIDQDLPSDRESLYYLNVQAIPSIERQDLENKNLLQFGIITRIKVFMRPSNLTVRVEDAPSMITASYQNKKLHLNNPSPYYLTLVNIKVDGIAGDNLMLEPFSSVEQKLNGKTISFQIINDYGAFSNTRKIRAQL